VVVFSSLLWHIQVKRLLEHEKNVVGWGLDFVRRELTCTDYSINIKNCPFWFHGDFSVLYLQRTLTEQNPDLAFNITLIFYIFSVWLLLDMTIFWKWLINSFVLLFFLGIMAGEDTYHPGVRKCFLQRLESQLPFETYFTSEIWHFSDMSN